jgi:hypothetical protein
LISIAAQRVDAARSPSVYLLWALIAFGLGGVWVRMNRTLGIAALMLILAYILLPRILLGSAYADMRLAPYVMLVAVIALVPKSASRQQAAIVACSPPLVPVADRGAHRISPGASAPTSISSPRSIISAGSRVFVEVASANASTGGRRRAWTISARWRSCGATPSPTASGPPRRAAGADQICPGQGLCRGSDRDHASARLHVAQARKTYPDGSTICRATRSIMSG